MPGKAKRFFRKRGGKGKKGNKAIATVGSVKRMMTRRTETKYHDLVALANAVDSAGSQNDLCIVAQGTSNTTRLGNRIRAQKIEMIVESTKSAAAIDFVRYIVFVWNNDTAATIPTLVGVLANTATLVNAPSACMTQISDQRDFRVLADWTHVLDANFPVRRTVKRINLKNRDMPYSDGVGAGNYHVYMLILGDQAPASGNKPTFTLNTRFYFKDA